MIIFTQQDFTCYVLRFTYKSVNWNLLIWVHFYRAKEHIRDVSKFLVISTCQFLLPANYKYNINLILNHLMKWYK